METVIQYEWKTVVHKLFEVAGVVLVEGIGKIGKTNFALWLSEELQKIAAYDSHANDFEPIVRKEDIASNIDTKGYYPQISDLINLKLWMYNNNHRKAYLFDEANEYLTNLRVMSSQNVGFTKLLPQTTKAHCRLIVIGHDFQAIDKNIMRQAWCRGLFRKTDLKTAILVSHLIPRKQRIEQIPLTSISYDPYAVAPFTEKPTSSMYFKDTEKQLLWNWSNGQSIKELNVHCMQLNRLARKYIRQSLENEFHLSHT